MFVFLSVFLFQITEIISISYDIIILEMDGSRKNVNAQVQPVGYRSFLLLHQLIHHRMSVLSSMHFYLPSKSTSCVICQYAAATFPFGSCSNMLIPSALISAARTENGILCGKILIWFPYVSKIRSDISLA